MKDGGTVDVDTQGLSATFDPALSYVTGTTDGPDMAAIYGQLCYQDSATGATEMSMATSIKASDGNTVWTLTLHPDMKFSDGTAFDAAAVAYNINRDAQPSVGSLLASVAAPLKLTAVNATTLQITLPAPNAQFAATFCQSFPFIGSPTAMKSEGLAHFGNAPVGGGPFKVQTLVPGSKLTLVKNPYYARFAPGEPRLNSLVFSAFTTQTQWEASMTSGTSQLGEFAASAGTIAKDLNGNGGLTVVTTATNGGGTLYFNTKTAPFNNVLARKAVTLALSRTAEASTRSPGSPPAPGLFAKSSPFYNAAYDFPQQDAATAQKLFNQLAAAGTPVNFTYIVPALAQFSINASSTQSQLSAYKNVTMNIKSVPASEYITDERDGNFQMTSGLIAYNNPVPVAVNTFKTKGTLNYVFWSNPKVDAALSDVMATTDLTKEKQDWATVEQQFNLDYPMYVSASSIFAVAYNPSVISGVALNTFGNIPDWGKIGYVK